MRINGLVMTALIALGVVIGYDKVAGKGGGLRKGI
jgi:hypothetical protein